jgi:gliding motility-associated-like protein
MKSPKHILILGILLSLYCPAAISQISSLCPNTALAPVFKQDFGQGVSSAYTSTAAAGSTNYGFGSVGTDGNYIITPLVENANKGDWTKGGDHTGNTNGNMFLVNAGGGNSIFFKQTVSGLCTGSSYNFSAWLANVNTPNTIGICGAGYVYPKVIFNIKDLLGNILGTLNTGNLPLSPNNGPVNWQQYGFQFTLPGGTTSLVLEMVDFYGGTAACGNDLALDDIVFSACTPQTYVSLTSASSICAGRNTTIQSSLVNNPYTTPAYQWQKSTDNGINWVNIGTPGTSAQNFSLHSVTASDNALYRVLVGPDVSSLSSATCITASNSISLQVFALPVMTVSNSGPTCSGTSLSLTPAIVSGAAPYQYSWTGPNAFSSTQSNPVITNIPNNAGGTYQLNLTDANGCSATAVTVASVNAGPVLSVTNNQPTLCSGTNTDLIFNSSIIGSAYTWSSQVVSGTVTGNSNNPTSSSVNTVSDQLVNINPANGTVRYVVTTTAPNGCTKSDSTTVTVYALPSAAVAGTDILLCNTPSVTLNATVPAIGTGTWLLVMGPSAVSIANPVLNNSNVTGLTSGTYVFAWTVSNNVCDAVSDSVTVTVLPVIDNLIDTTTKTICKGQSVSVSASVAGGGNGTYQYQWQKSADGSTWTDITGASGTGYSFVPDTSLYLRRTVISSSCNKQSDVVYVHVLTNLSNNTISADQEICKGAFTTLILGSTPSGGDGSYVFKWEQSTDNGTTWVTINNAVKKDLDPMAVSVNSLFRRTVSSNACSGTFSIVSNTVRVTTKEKAKAAMVATILNTCSPMNVLFENTSISDSASYHLFFGDGTDSMISKSGTYTHVYHTGSATTFYARLLATDGCGTDSLTLPIAALPNPAVSKMQLKDTAVCGVPFTLILSNNSTGSTQFRWDWGDGSTPYVTTVIGALSHTYETTGEYLITHTISSSCSDSMVYRPLFIYPNVKAVTGPIVTDACLGDAIVFKNLSDSSLSFEWNYGDGKKSFLGTDTHHYLNPGNYISALKVWSTHPQLTCSDSSIHTTQVVANKKGQFSVSDTISTCLPFVLHVSNQSGPSVKTTWIWGDGSSGEEDTATHQYVSNGRYTVIMQAINEGGCVYIDSSHVTINAPSVQLQYKGGVYCELNKPIEFLPRASNTDSIRWNFGDGIIITTAAQKISHAYAQAGSFVPKLELINTTHACIIPVTASDTLRIDQVKPDFKISAVYDCGKTTYHFTDSSHSFFPVNNRVWTIDQNQAGSNAIYQYPFTASGSHTTSLQIQNIYGCTNALQATFSVAIYQYPQANINAISEACLNNLMELKSVVNSVDSVKARFWNLGNGSIATDSVVKVSYYNEGKYTVKLMVSTVNSCFDSAYKEINIHPSPKIDIAADQFLCKGDSMQLKASGAMNYIWKDQNDTVICTNCSTVSVHPQKNTHYHVIGYSQFGCTQIATTNVRVIQPFKLSVKTPDSICVGDTKRLLVSGASKYSWQPDPSLSNTTIATPSITPVINTTYHVIGKDSYQCFADTAEIKIIVGKPTSVSVGKDTVVLSGVPVQLNAVSSQQNIRKWQWTGNATYSCLSCPSPTAKVIFDECLTCAATNIYGCVSTDTVCIKTFCPSAEVFIPNAFSPDGDGINDVLMVQGRGLKMVKSFRIFSRWGEMVFEKTNFLPGDAAAAWDGRVRGKPASPDVYVYVCEVICERGIPATYKGNVAILK